ncbi:MAG: hypothetical protein IJY19_00285 [Ruminococcus sp.]|nr:hypothetical protein [Ruminococcus sp.]
MNAYIIMKNADGTENRENAILYFSFRKEAYLPYTMLSVRFISSSDSFLNVTEIKLYVGDKLVHHGLIDTIETTNSGGGKISSVVSRGFTSLLCQNQIEPGLKIGISINKLMNSFYTLPNITHEDNSDESNYIYVGKNSTMWDGIVNLAYRFSGRYPFIRDTNCVRITPVSEPASFSYHSSELISTGSALTQRRLLSHLHMSDINGDYGQYEYTDTEAVSANIIRHKFFEMDQEFLNDPENALFYHNKFDSREKRRFFCCYSGYNGEDLSDLITFSGVVSERISAVSIKGSKRGIFTEISVYHDKFPH